MKKRDLLVKFFTSSPKEYQILKSILGFIVGTLIGLGFHYLVLAKINLPYPLDVSLDLFVVLCFAFGYATSSQVRCILILLIPLLFGKNGRAYFKALVILYLIKGPATNIAANLGEISRSISCGLELAFNLTKARAKLRTQPLDFIMSDMKSQARRVHNVTSDVQTQFSPAEVEVHDETETAQLQGRTNNIDRSSKLNRVKTLENKYKSKEQSNKQSEKVEGKYEKKLDYRCEEVFSMGVISCRRLFKKTERDCMDKLSVLGYLLCLPLKLTILCELARLVPGASGLNCDAMDAVRPGFGESFDTAETAATALDKNFEVNVQYKVVNNPEVLTKLTPEDVSKAMKNEFNFRKQWIDFFVGIFGNVLSFMSLRILWSSYKYNQGFTKKFQHDNFYITKYFIHIDERRKAENKQGLFPLKKLEKKKVLRPGALKMTKAEKSAVIFGTFLLIVKMIIVGIIVFMDKVMYEILSIVNRNSQVDYEQKGIHRIDIKVNGTGAMAHLMRSLLLGFNQEHELEQEATNDQCLPEPTKTPTKDLVMILVLFIFCFILTIFQAYVLRTRRVIAAFFYRKREKKRILFLYNDMLKQRVNFIRHAKSTIKKRAREQRLEVEVGIYHYLAQLCFCSPSLKNYFDKKNLKQKKCLVCEESLGKNGVNCPTPGCSFAYCEECWLDIEENCYACRGKDDWSTESSDEMDSS